MPDTLIKISDETKLEMMRKWNTNRCWKCDKQLKVNDLIVNVKRSGKRIHTTRNFHKKCYDNWGY